jgi:hypothetical protein
VIGVADLIAAVTLGIGSAPGSPVRFIYESADAATLGSLPWILIPAIFVPLYLVTHLVMFMQLLRRTPTAASGPDFAWGASSAR